MMKTMKPCVTMLLFLGVVASPAAPLFLTVSNRPPTASGLLWPISIQIDRSRVVEAVGAADQLQLAPSGEVASGPPILAQFEADAPDSPRGTLWWLLPPGPNGAQKWLLERRATPLGALLHIQQDPATGQWDISEAGVPVLRYNYQTNEPGAVLAKVRPGDLKYARARSDYIHPIYGPEGEELTKDWSVDHPHHRGIYWAWPEVDYHGERGDLHALQRVFARPTGQCVAEGGPVFARLEAENLWLWDDRDAIVRERTLIRVWHGDANGRFVDLEFQFTALKDEVALARRETKLYGGLNVRLSAVKEQQIVLHTDPVGAVPRSAWADLSGMFAGGKGMNGLAIFQHPTNPDYPGDWIQYPEINWFQPTFPTAGTRFVLKKDQPLTLRYRLWIHAGRVSETGLSQLWAAYELPPLVTAK